MRSLIPLALLSVVLGCTHHEQDSHTEVFKTSQEMQSDRRARQLQAHKELALTILRAARPDIESTASDGTMIAVHADDVTRKIDLLPMEEEMVRHSSEERSILRKYLIEQLKPFDFDRLAALGFEKIRKQVTFELVNVQTLSGMQLVAGTSKLISQPVAANVHRVVVIHRSPQVSTIPINESLLKMWNIEPARVELEALTNLHETLKAAGDRVFETIPFGSDGNTGNIKSGVDPSVILLPEFLVAVQNAWKTKDNLVLFLPASTGITFVEQHNQKLLDLLVPRWKGQLTVTPNALCNQLLLRDPDHISYADYRPTTKPVTLPATKPRPYIVH